MDHEAPESICIAGGHNAHVERWLESFTAVDYTLEHRKGGTNVTVVFLSRLPEPATEYDRSGSSSFTPVDHGGIYLFRACGLSTSTSQVAGVGWGGLVPRPDSDVLGGLSSASSAFRDDCAHRPRMRIDGISDPSGRFVAGEAACLTTVDIRPGRGDVLPAANTACVSGFPYPPRASRAPHKPPMQRQV